MLLLNLQFTDLDLRWPSVLSSWLFVVKHGMIMTMMMMMGLLLAILVDPSLILQLERSIYFFT